MVSSCLAKICARKNQLPGYHPKQVSNFTSSLYYAFLSPRSTAEPTSLSFFDVGMHSVCSRFQSFNSLHTGLPEACSPSQRPLNPNVYSDSTPVLTGTSLTAGRHGPLDAPSSLLTGETKDGAALRSSWGSEAVSFLF